MPAGSAICRWVSDRQSSISAWPTTPNADAYWSMTPLFRPMNPFSARCTSFTSSSVGIRGACPPDSAQPLDSSIAALDERPAPCGRSEASNPRKPIGRAPVRWSAQVMPRT